MKFGNFISFLFLIFETFFYLVSGKTNQEEKNDCTKFNNFINGDNKIYSDECCSDFRIKCKDGYITSIDM